MSRKSRFFQALIRKHLSRNYLSRKQFVRIRYMIHERSLRIIYNDKQSSFTEFLNKNILNIQRFAIEILRFYNALSPSLMNNIFNLRAENLYNLRHFSEFSRPMVKSVYHGTESISYLGQKIWDILPDKLKNIENLELFKKDIKTWKFELAM